MYSIIYKSGKFNYLLIIFPITITNLMFYSTLFIIKYEFVILIFQSKFKYGLLIIYKCVLISYNIKNSEIFANLLHILK